jgi:hypothetical protein
MSNWHNKVDVTYSVSTYFLSNFNTTTVTNDSFVTILLYFPQAHSKSFTGPKFFHRKDHHAGLCVRLIVSGFKTSPLDSFKIDSGEARPIDILLNLFTGFLSLFIISIIHHVFLLLI